MPIGQISYINWDQIPTVQSGKGIVGYRGSTRYQRGSGIGTVLRSIFRMAKPIGTRVLKNLANEGAEAAALIGSDFAEGEDLRSSAKKRTMNAARNLVRKAVKSRRKRGSYQRFKDEVSGNGSRKKQKGSGRRIGYKRKRAPKKKRHRQIGYGRKKKNYKKKPIRRRKAIKPKSDYWN